MEADRPPTPPKEQEKPLENTKERYTPSQPPNLESLM